MDIKITEALFVKDQLNDLISEKDVESYSFKEFDNIKKIIINIVPIYISENIMDISSPKYHDNMFKDLLKKIIGINKKFIKDEVELILYSFLRGFYRFIIPRRSYPGTFVRKIKNKQDLQYKIDYLKNTYQPPQRTKEWHKFRHDLITASTAHEAFGAQGSINRLIYSKCQPLNLDKVDKVYLNSPCHHGNRFEPVALMIYEKKFNTKVDDFGCIRDNVYQYLGASPDGICVDNTSPLFARMVEIKCVTTREITGIPLKSYWIQMQMQMGVCRLNECDFVECKFSKYEDEDEFNCDGNFYESEDGKTKGIILFFIDDKTGNPVYEYKPLEQSPEEFCIWEKEQIDKHTKLGHIWNNNIYWKLDVFSCVLVLRNKLWFKSAVVKLGEIWDIILKERITGYEHRAPKKRVFKNSFENEGCLIKLDL